MLRPWKLEIQLDHQSDKSHIPSDCRCNNRRYTIRKAETGTAFAG